MSGRAASRDAPGSSGFKIRGCIEPCDERCSSGRHTTRLGCSSRAHLNQRFSLGGRHHSRRRRGNRTVVIENRQHERLENDGLGKRSFDFEDWRTGKKQFALAISTDISGEPIRRQVIDSRGRHHIFRVEPVQDLVSETKLLDGVNETTDSRKNSIATARMQTTREDFENAPALCVSIAQSCVDHGEFVSIGKQCGRIRHTDYSSRNRS